MTRRDTHSCCDTCASFHAFAAMRAPRKRHRGRATLRAFGVSLAFVTSWALSKFTSHAYGPRALSDQGTDPLALCVFVVLCVVVFVVTRSL